MPFALIVATACGIAIWPSATVMSAVKQALADPASIFADRSPGERDPGALTQTKEALPMLNDASDMPALPPPETMQIDAAPLPIPGEEMPKAFSAIVPPEQFAAGLPVGNVPGNPGIILPLAGPPAEVIPGTNLPDLPVLGTPPPPPVIVEGPPPAVPGPPVEGPPVPGVPEPASWATMIVGFLTIGTILRRRARADKAKPGKA
jgi:hypothetical protein